MLDGKYEIISQRPLGPRSTLFDATAPNGAAVRVAWYDLEASEEAAFERYRKLLRKLRREEVAEIYDLVSRPGAHYVAWSIPPSEDCDNEGRRAIAHLLETHGWSLDNAHICADREGAYKVYGLAFERSEFNPSLSEAPRARTAQPVGAAPREEKQKRVASWSTPWLPGAVLALLGVALLASSLYRPLTRDFVVVPNMRGQEVEEALGVLQELGLGTSSSPVFLGRSHRSSLEQRAAAGYAA